MINFRRLRWYVTTPLCVVSTVGLMAAASPKALCPSDIAAAWVQQHHATLPTDLTTLGTYDLAYRKAIYNHLQPEVQSRLWREHLVSFLAPSTTLTPEQQTFVREVMAKLDDYVRDPERGRAAVTRDQLTERSKLLFGPALAKTIFATLGPVGGTLPSRPAMTQASVLSGADALVRAIGSTFGVKRALPDCTCAIGSDLCGSQSICVDWWQCTKSDHGCGFIWLYPCDGTCL
jgi:hypothetical protein